MVLFGAVAPDHFGVFDVALLTLFYVTSGAPPPRAAPPRFVAQRCMTLYQNYSHYCLINNNVTPGEPWPSDLPTLNSDGTANWVVGGYTVSFTVIVHWVILEVHAHARARESDVERKNSCDRGRGREGERERFRVWGRGRVRNGVGGGSLGGFM